MRAINPGKIGDYRVLGHTCRAFRKTRTQIYDLPALIQACNYGDYNSDDGLSSLRNLLQLVRIDPAVAVVDAMPARGFGRRVCSVKGSRIRAGTGRMWSGINPRYIMNYCPMQREVRQHLAHMLYWDIDIVNCHPVLAAQIFRALGYDCPILDEYIARRDEMFRDIETAAQCEREHAKELMLRVVNDGSAENWACRRNAQLPPWVSALAEEMKANRDRLLAEEEYCAVLETAITERREHPRRSAFSWILQDWERRIMECCVIAAESEGFIVDAIIHDGWMVRKCEKVLDTPMSVQNRYTPKSNHPSTW
jgi:hypothetical protein